MVVMARICRNPVVARVLVGGYEPAGRQLPDARPTMVSIATRARFSAAMSLAKIPEAMPVARRVPASP